MQNKAILQPIHTACVTRPCWKTSSVSVLPRTGSTNLVFTSILQAGLRDGRFETNMILQPFFLVGTGCSILIPSRGDPQAVSLF